MTRFKEIWAIVVCVAMLALVFQANAQEGFLVPAHFIRPPAIRPNPNASVPLAAILEFATSKPVRVVLHLGDGSSTRSLYESTTYSQEYSIPVLGLRPARRERILLTVLDEDGFAVGSPNGLEFVTDPLPDMFPAIDLRIIQPDQMEPGITLFNLNRGNDITYGMIVAVNEKGEVVWYYRSDKSVGEVRRIRNGNLLMLDAAGAAEIDMLGNVVRRWHGRRGGLPPDPTSIPIATDILHHDLSELPSGELLTLSTEVQRLANYPASETDPGSPPELADVAGDLVVEFRTDGTVLREWSLLDILDPLRLGFGSLGAQWNSSYPEAIDGTRDWSHANAVVYDPLDDSMLVSLRHQDAVVKIDRKTGSLVWILGDHAGWNAPWNRYLLRPEGNIEWPYHQHAPMITDHGTIVLFDNGNFRHRPFDGQPDRNFSRAVEYAVDPAEMTVAEVWSWGGPEDELFFSGALGDANWLPSTGNVLVTDGFRVDSGPPATRFARIVEVTRTKPATKVFEMILRDPADQPGVGWRVYRSDRLPSLYP